MIARIGLIAAGVLLWVALGVGLVQTNAAPQAEHIAVAGRSELAANHSRLALAAEQTFAARLPEVETLAAVLGLGKGLEPQDARKKNSAPKESVNLLSNRTQAAIGALPGAPLYAIVAANGSVVAATLWPEQTVVRAEPAVASALAGVSRLSVWRKDGQPFMLAAAPALGSDGSPVGVLVVARPLGKEVCDEIAQVSGLKLFALSVAADKISCTGGAEAAGLTALKPGAQSLFAQALPEPPLFVDATNIGTALEARAFRSELPGSSIIAGADLRPAFSAMRERQVHAAILHLGLLIPIALFTLLFAMVLGQSAGRMANHLSMVLQQGEKAGMLDEHHYNGRMRRLAKNVNGLLLRSPVKAPNDKISLMLGTVDEPSDDAHEIPLTAAPKTAPIPYDTPRVVEAPKPAALPTTPAPTKAPVNAQPNPLASPFDSNELSNAFGDSFDSDDEPTRLVTLPRASDIVPKASDIAPRPPAAPATPSFASPSFGDSLLSSKSLGDSRSFASEEFRFGDNTPAAPPPTLPDLPQEEALHSPPASKPSGGFSENEADAALGSLASWTPEFPSSTPSAAAGPAAAAPAGPSPWDAGLAHAPGIDPSDPDAAHFQETYDQFVRTRAQCGETGDLPLAKFVDKLKKSREQVMQRQNCQKVRFQVYVKEGKAALKAVAFR